MTLQTAVGLAFLKEIVNYTAADFASLGIPREDMNLTIGNALWNRTHRPRVERVIEAVIHGSMDAHGLPRFSVPAEYVAAVLCLINPMNTRVACYWVSERKQTGVPASKLSQPQAGTEQDPATASQLFALVSELNVDEQSTHVRQLFAQRINGRAAKAQGLVDA